MVGKIPITGGRGGCILTLGPAFDWVVQSHRGGSVPQATSEGANSAARPERRLNVTSQSPHWQKQRWGAQRL